MKTKHWMPNMVIYLSYPFLIHVTVQIIQCQLWSSTYLIHSSYMLLSRSFSANYGHLPLLSIHYSCYCSDHSMPTMVIFLSYPFIICITLQIIQCQLLSSSSLIHSSFMLLFRSFNASYVRLPLSSIPHSCYCSDHSMPAMFVYLSYPFLIHVTVQIIQCQLWLVMYPIVFYACTWKLRNVIDHIFNWTVLEWGMAENLCSIQLDNFISDSAVHI